MRQTFGIRQSILKHAYDEGLYFMKFHPDLAEKFRKKIEGLPHYTNISDAIQAFLDLFHAFGRKPFTGMPLIWAEVGKDGDYYYVMEDYLIVTDDNRMHYVAEHLAMVEFNNPEYLKRFIK